MNPSRIVNRVLARRVVSRYLEAVPRMMFYHGTAAKNLKSISVKGLVADSGAKWGGNTALDRSTKAVFLTTDFEIAARYAYGSLKKWVPLVLEVVITSPRRFRNLKYDPMDRIEDAWDLERDYDESYEDVKHDILETASVVGSMFAKGTHPSERELGIPDGVESFNGMNVYQSIVGALVSKLNLDRRERDRAMQQVQKRLGGKEWEYLEVRPNGTIKLTEEYFYTREQLMYMKGLPPKTIKGVWVRLGDFGLSPKDVLETRQGGFKDLPGEAAGRYHQLQELFGKMRWEAPQSPRDVKRWQQEASADDFTELAEFLGEWAHMDEEELQEAAEDWDDALENLEMGLQEDWGEERIHEVSLWGKLTLREALRITQRSKQYTLPFWGR